MLRAAKRMAGYRIRAADGDIGKVADWYFDGQTWNVRYLVVDTGGWLSGRNVLLSPAVAGTPDEEEKVIPVSLNREQVRNSPPTETDMPVSRQHEIALRDYYGWPAYWTMGLAPGAFETVGPAPVPADTGGTEGEQPPEKSGDPNLRSAKEVAGYTIDATDGSIGHVEDLIIDDEPWLIRYLLVDTTNWWPGGHVLVATRFVRAVSWVDAAVALDLTREAVRNSPPFDASRPVNREYEQRIYEYYERAGGKGPAAGAPHGPVV